MHPLLGIRKELRHSTGNEKSVNILLDLLCSFEKGKQTPQKICPARVTVNSQHRLSVIRVHDLSHSLMTSLL